MGNIISHTKENTLRNEAWLSAVKEHCAAGLSLSSIPKELERQQLQPVDARTLKKYIQAGSIPSVTWEHYVETKRIKSKENGRRRKPSKAMKVWLAVVESLMADGLSLSEISAELKRRDLKPSSTYAVAQKLLHGEIPGMSKEKYEAAKAERQSRLFHRWCDVVRPLLLEGVPIVEIEAYLFAKQYRYASETTIRQFLREGKIHGVTLEDYQAAVKKRAGQDDKSA